MVSTVAMEVTELLRLSNGGEGEFSGDDGNSWGVGTRPTGSTTYRIQQEEPNESPDVEEHIDKSEHVVEERERDGEIIGVWYVRVDGEVLELFDASSMNMSWGSSGVGTRVDLVEVPDKLLLISESSDFDEQEEFFTDECEDDCDDEW